VKSVDHIKITIGKKPFGNYKVISKDAFKNDIVTLITFNNQEFIWIPTWKEIGAILEATFTAENINRVNRNKDELSFKQHLCKMKMKVDLGEIKDV